MTRTGCLCSARRQIQIEGWRWKKKVGDARWRCKACHAGRYFPGCRCCVSRLLFVFFFFCILLPVVIIAPGAGASSHRARHHRTTCERPTSCLSSVIERMNLIHSLPVIWFASCQVPHRRHARREHHRLPTRPSRARRGPDGPAEARFFALFQNVYLSLFYQHEVWTLQFLSFAFARLMWFGAEIFQPKPRQRHVMLIMMESEPYSEFLSLAFARLKWLSGAEILSRNLRKKKF